MIASNGNIILQKHQFHPYDIIGQGATGNVCKGYRLKDRQRVAIKTIDMKKVSNQVTKYLLQGQKTAMATIKSPYVIQTFDIIQARDYCYIVMELCSGGTLKDYIKKKGKLEQKEAIDIFRKILAGYIAVTQAKIIHRDLKTSNIMLRKNNEPVIIDFGYCEMIFGKRPFIQYNVGSPSYMSPQAYAKSMYSQKSDIWALGVILYQMLTGHSLDQGFQSQKYFNSLKKSTVALYNPNQFSPLVKQIFDRAFIVNPLQRATSLKLKYIIDKSMIGKQMPIQKNKQPIPLPSKLKKQKSLNTDFFNTSNLYPPLCLKKQISQIIKPKYNQHEFPLKPSQNIKNHYQISSNRPKITFENQQSVSSIYFNKIQIQNQSNLNSFQNQTILIRKKSENDVPTIFQSNPIKNLTDNSNNMISNKNHHPNFIQITQNNNQKNERINSNERIKFQVIGPRSQKSIINNVQQIEINDKKNQFNRGSIGPKDNIKSMIKIHKINSQRDLNKNVNNYNGIIIKNQIKSKINPGISLNFNNKRS